MAFQQDIAEAALKLSMAMLCGGVVGWNRQREHRPAGLRTLMLVAIGASAFALIGQRLGGADPASRVLGGLLGGIGFLGAGSIIRAHEHVWGVTTAAAIWVTAGLGCACGLGEYAIAIIGTGLTMMVLWLAPMEQHVFGKEQEQETRDAEKDDSHRSAKGT